MIKKLIKDLFVAMKAHEMAEALQLTEIRDRAWQINPVSAVTGEGLKASKLGVCKLFHLVVSKTTVTSMTHLSSRCISSNDRPR